MLRASFVTVAIVAIAAPPTDAALFVPLGFRSGGSFSEAQSLSADGTKIIGTSGGLQRATRWTISGGLVTAVDALDLLPGGLISLGQAVSSNGQFAAGSASPGPTMHATRWNGTTATDLGTLVGPSGDSYGNAMSSDGSVIVGSSDTSLGSGEAFRWSGGTMVGLGFLNGGSDSGASGVSADGLYVVGASDYSVGVGEEGQSFTEAFVWNGGVMSGLGFISGGSRSSATAITPDGTTIVGTASDVNFDNYMVRWVSDGQGGYTLQSLGALGSNGGTNDISDDGSVIVGYSVVGNTYPNDLRAMYWSQESGLQLLQTILTNQGLDLTGWTLYEATDVSADGTKIVGYGLNPFGQTEGFYAEVAPVPEPSSLLTAGGVAAVAAWIRRRRRAR